MRMPHEALLKPGASLRLAMSCNAMLQGFRTLRTSLTQPAGGDWGLPSHSVLWAYWGGEEDAHNGPAASDLWAYSRASQGAQSVLL